MKANKGKSRLILRLLGISVGRWYSKRRKKGEKSKRGPKVAFTDEAVHTAVLKYFEDPIFYNEGYKKLKHRLSAQGIEVGKERLRRIMKEHGLLLNGPNRERKSPYEHRGTIKTQQRNEMWGSDIKEFHLQFGKVYFISLIDHFHGKIVGHNVSTSKDTGYVMDALRIAIRNEFGSVDQGICEGLSFQIRQDNGSQYDSKKYRREAEYLGIKLSNTMVRSPQSNGVIERFHKTLNEQMGVLNTQSSFEQTKDILDQFVKKFNSHWLYHRHHLKSPEMIEGDTGNRRQGGESSPTQECRLQADAI